MSAQANVLPFAGQIATAIRKVRQMVDDPAAGAKYSDADLLGYMNDSWAECLNDIYNMAENPPIASLNISVTGGTEFYNLPPSVGEVIRCGLVDSTTGLYQSEILPRGHYHPYGSGIEFQGTHRIRLSPIPSEGSTQTLVLEYIPSGDVALHVGKFTAASASTSGFTLASGGYVTDSQGNPMGRLDTRPNAYLGAQISLIGHENGNVPSGATYYPVQNRIVASHTSDTGVVTVSPVFDFNPGQSSLDTDSSAKYQKYEVYPVEAPMIWPVVTRHTARVIAMMEGQTSKVKLLTSLYEEAKRSASLRMANFQTRVGKKMDNMLPERSEVWGEW